MILLQSDENNEEVKIAYQRLLDQVIPSFAKSLDDIGDIPDFDQFISKLHNAGINVRFVTTTSNTLCLPQYTDYSVMFAHSVRTN